MKINVDAVFASIEERFKIPPPFEKEFISNMVITKGINIPTTLVQRSFGDQVLNIKVQGPYTTCSLYALINTVGDLTDFHCQFSYSTLNNIADQQWFQHAASSCIINNIINSNRSLTCDYNIDILRSAVEESGYQWENICPTFTTILNQVQHSLPS